MRAGARAARWPEPKLRRSVLVLALGDGIAALLSGCSGSPMFNLTMQGRD